MAKEKTEKTHSLSLPFEWVFKALFTPSSELLGQRLPDWWDSLTHRKKLEVKKYSELKKLLEDNKHRRRWEDFSEGKSYLFDEKISEFMSDLGYFLTRRIKGLFVEKFEINSYDQRDIFFAAMELFFKYLTKDDIEKIYQKHQDNNQAIIWPFLGDVERQKPKLLSVEQKEYFHTRKDFYDSKK